MTNTDAVPTSPAVIGYDTYGDVLNELDRDHIAWQPQEGAKVSGKVVAITTATSEYGSYPLLVLDPGPNQPLVDVHCFHTWLKSDVVRARLREGDIVGIKYLDRDGPRNAARYRLAVRHTGKGDVYSPPAEVARNTDAVDNLFEEKPF